MNCIRAECKYTFNPTGLISLVLQCYGTAILKKVQSDQVKMHALIAASAGGHSAIDKIVKRTMRGLVLCLLVQCAKDDKDDDVAAVAEFLQHPEPMAMNFRQNGRTPLI